MPDLRGNGFEPKDVFLEKMNRALAVDVGETRPPVESGLRDSPRC